jgi:RNA polymerase sigma-70 factor (ECF subfamily)
VDRPDRERQSPFGIGEWIIDARAGSAEALGKLMEFSRQYLLLIANDELPADLQAKGGPSDLVQQTQLEAVGGFAAFRGQTAAELLAWLRQILLHNLRDFTRRFGVSAKRRARREVSLSEDDSAQQAANELADHVPSPLSWLGRQERAAVVERALQELAEDHRQVIVWHHRENRSFEEIATLIGRTPGAVRKLWARAIQQLQKRLQTADASGSKP